MHACMSVIKLQNKHLIDFHVMIFENFKNILKNARKRRKRKLIIIHSYLFHYNQHLIFFFLFFRTVQNFIS